MGRGHQDYVRQVTTNINYARHAHIDVLAWNGTRSGGFTCLYDDDVDTEMGSKAYNSAVEVEFDIFKVAKISTIRVLARTDSVNDGRLHTFYVKKSNDGSTWTDLCYYTYSGGAARKIWFFTQKDVTFRYLRVRVSVDNDPGPGSCGIKEVFIGYER